MARPKLNSADFFPHYCRGEELLFVIEERYKNDGYAFWFKLRETLGAAPNHFLRRDDIKAWSVFRAKARLNEQKCIEILDYMAEIWAVDQDLWRQDGTIWIQELVDDLSELYRKRSSEPPQKPSFRAGNRRKPPGTGVSAPETPSLNVSGVDNPQREEKEEKEEREKDFIALSPEIQAAGQKPDSPDTDQVTAYPLAEHEWKSFISDFPPRNGQSLDDLDECKLLFLTMHAHWPDLHRAKKNYKASKEVADGIVMYLLSFLRGKFRRFLSPPQP